MTEMKEKVTKMNWHLITEGSSQQKANKGKKSLWKGGEPMLSCNSNCNSNSHSPPRQAIFILLFVAIVLSIATILNPVFGFKSREFGDFNNDFNVLNNDFELEQNGLIDNEYGLCDVLQSPVFDIIGVAAYTPPAVFEFIKKRTELLHEFGDLATTVTNENDIGMKNKSWPNGQHTNTQTQQQQHTAAPVIDSDDNFGATGIGLTLMTSIWCGIKWKWIWIWYR